MDIMQPTAFELALALTINRLKPSEKSVREYILDLRKHIYPGRRPQFSATYEESQKNYINAALYFEAQRKDAEKENEALLNEISSLKRQLAALGEVPIDNVWPSRNSKKRKKAPVDGQDGVVKDEFSVHIEHLADKFKKAGKNDKCMALLRNLFDLQSGLHAVPVDDLKIYEHLKRTCSSFRLVLLDITIDSSADTTTRRQILEGMPLVIAAIFSGLREVIESNSTEISGSRSRPIETSGIGNRTAYSILTLFQGILEAIRVTSITNNTHAAQGQAQLQRPNESLEQLQARASDTKQMLDHLGFLGRTYIALLLNGNSKAQQSSNSALQGGYSDILEGTLHLMLSRTGQLLYTVTFGVERRESLEAEILSTPSDAPHTVSLPSKQQKTSRRENTNVAGRPNQSHKGHNETGSGGASQPKAADVEARYLVQFLELLLPAFSPSPSASSHVQQHSYIERTPQSAPCRVPNAQKNVESAEAGQSQHRTVAPGGGGVVSKRGIAAKPWHVLQNTLVEGIFGSASGAESAPDNGGFSETLRAPKLLLESFQACGNPCEETAANNFEGGEGAEESASDGKWFARRMWELVGWDVLAKGVESGFGDGRGEAVEGGLVDGAEYHI